MDVIFQHSIVSMPPKRTWFTLYRMNCRKSMLICTKIDTTTAL